MTSARLLVFTDMDGTLLDHDNYSWQAAEPALAELTKQEIPVICNTSKTFAEVKQLHQQLGLSAPFIVENGSAIYSANAETADQPAHNIGAKRQQILSELSFLRQQGHQFEGFNDWHNEEIVQQTGLSIAEAELSGQRQYSEPLLYKGNEQQKAQFIEYLQAKNYLALQGGRFLSIQGQCDKGKALLKLKAEYENLWQTPVITIALGDSQNDCAMLEAADVSVWIKSHKAFPTIQKKEQVFYSDLFGPAGWNETMAHILLLHSNKQLKPVTTS
ncbi:HAD-IIB family hydrolase [Catenovulum agarivorans]|uniref:HAD-IIB family hydrolase n=1 Tax=Catenovulum agarivorans TaxID=1172192 RepID=UPI0002D7C5F3|nr:HAD-IIB family hydrolase [Catenovulum agarivorans]